MLEIGGQPQVIVGKILAPYGVRGWIKVESHTEPPGNILKYLPWSIGHAPDDSVSFQVIAGKAHGHQVIAQLDGVQDRDAAVLLRGKLIRVARDHFPATKPGEYYWVDLMGLEVQTTDGMVLGKVVGMLETGANDVMEVQGERDRLIPFVVGEFVKDVRLGDGYLVVDWDPDF